MYLNKNALISVESRLLGVKLVAKGAGAVILLFVWNTNECYLS